MANFIAGLCRLASSAISPAGRRGRLIILIYHRVLESPDTLRPEEPDRSVFDWQMSLVARSFNVLPLREAVQRLQEGCLPARAACITFDDGYADNVDVALPVLRRYRLTATFFVASAFLDGGCMWNDTVIETVRQLQGPVLDLTPLGMGEHYIGGVEQRRATVRTLIERFKHLPYDEREEMITILQRIGGVDAPKDLMLTSSQVRTLVKEGMQIGGHTLTHPILTRLDDERAYREISQGKVALEDITGQQLDLFAYPNGLPGRDYDERHVEMVRNAGFTAAVSTQWGAATATSDPFQLPRFTPWHHKARSFHVALVRNYLR